MKASCLCYFPPYRDGSDDKSDTSSISQSSYDPSKPVFSGMSAEIPETSDPAKEEADTGGIVLISAKSKPDAGTSSDWLLLVPSLADVVLCYIKANLYTLFLL